MRGQLSALAYTADEQVGTHKMQSKKHQKLLEQEFRSEEELIAQVSCILGCCMEYNGLIGIGG